MRLVVSLGVLGFMLAAAAMPAQAQSDPESAQILCDLTGDCATEVADPNAAAADPAAEPVRGEARGGNTRGFSFRRAGAPAAQRTTRVANATIPATVRPTRPAQVGASDLGLTFLPNSSSLTDTAKSRLAKYAAVLAGPKLDGRRLRIEGHTDSTGSAALNRDLSRRRAQSVADFLIASGIDRQRLVVVGYGSSHPLPGKPTTAPENRRVMAVLL